MKYKSNKNGRQQERLEGENYDIRNDSEKWEDRERGAGSGFCRERRFLG